MGLIGWGCFTFGTQIIRIVTNHGELVIDAKDEAVKIEVLKNGNVVRVIDTKTDQRIDIEAGNYLLRLKENNPNIVLTGNVLSLKRGEREIVSVKRILNRPIMASRAAIKLSPVLVQSNTNGNNQNIRFDVKVDKNAIQLLRQGRKVFSPVEVRDQVLFWILQPLATSRCFLGANEGKDLKGVRLNPLPMKSGSKTLRFEIPEQQLDQIEKDAFLFNVPDELRGKFDRVEFVAGKSDGSRQNSSSVSSFPRGPIDRTPMPSDSQFTGPSFLLECQVIRSSPVLSYLLNSSRRGVVRVPYRRVLQHKLITRSVVHQIYPPCGRTRPTIRLKIALVISGHPELVTRRIAFLHRLPTHKQGQQFYFPDQSNLLNVRHHRSNGAHQVGSGHNLPEIVTTLEARFLHLVLVG